MTVETLTRGPHPGLIDWLAVHHVEYEMHEHPETFTAEATARAEHLDPRSFIKVVGVVAGDGRRMLLLVDADDHVDLAKARHALDADDVRIMTEAEFAALAPECETGTVPPVPELFGVPVCADYAVRDTPEVAFHAGSHRYTVHVDRHAWERAIGVTYADLAQGTGRPAWAH